MGRVLHIDVLRAVAVLLVFGRHLLPCPKESPAAIRGFFEAWGRGGWIGVDVFFVISGFLVSGLLLEEQRKHRSVDVFRFLLRRAFKIYPAFWVMILVTLLVRAGTGRDWSVARLSAELLFLQNYFEGLWNHTWSLAVEEHFYLLLAGVFGWLARGRSSDPFARVPWICGALSVTCLVLRLSRAAQQAYDPSGSLFASHLRMDSLAFGVLISWIRSRYPTGFMAFAARNRFGLVLAGLFLLSPAFFVPLEASPWVYTWGLTVFSVGSGCLLCGALGLEAVPLRLTGLVVRALAGLGRNSYSVYLWHMPVLAWGYSLGRKAGGGGGAGWGVYAISGLVGSFVVGVIMTRLVETPALKLRDRWFASRSA